MWINSVPKLRENKSKPRKHKKSKWISAGENPSGAQHCRFGDGCGTPYLSKRLPKNGKNTYYRNHFEITSTFSNWYYILAVAICFILVPKEIDQLNMPKT